MSDIVFVDDYFLLAQHKDFSGHYIKSKNEQHMVAWSDGYLLVDEEFGNEAWVDGSYILFEEEKAILHRTFERPSNGAVANDGTHVVAENFFSDELVSSIFVFSKYGKELLSHRFSANLGTMFFSNNGQYIICQLGNSNSQDASTVAMFDVLQGRLLWQKVPEIWVADYFELDIQNEIICFGYKYWSLSDEQEEIKFRYKLDGTFIDYEAWYSFRLRQGNGFQILEIADEKSKQICYENTNDVTALLELYFLAAERLIEHPYFCSNVYRKIGEIYERVNSIEKAIENYKIALELNPKVGVKRKLKNLEESI